MEFYDDLSMPLIGPLLAPFFMLLLIGCAGAQSNTEPQKTRGEVAPAEFSGKGEGAGSDASPIRVPLELRRLTEEPGEAPLIRARVNGEETWLLLDSGSSHHVLGRTFADKIGVEATGPSIDGSGAANDSVQPVPLPALKVTLEDAQIHLDNALALPWPQMLESKGVDGVLSPEHLSDRGYVLVDFPGRELIIFASEPQLRAWMEKQTRKFSTQPVRFDENGA